MYLSGNDLFHAQDGKIVNPEMIEYVFLDTFAKTEKSVNIKLSAKGLWSIASDEDLSFLTKGLIKISANRFINPNLIVAITPQHLDKTFYDLYFSFSKIVIGEEDRTAIIDAINYPMP